MAMVDSLLPRADDDDNTTQQLKTHSTESRIVCYPFHPWHDLAVFIHEAVVRGGFAVFRCSQEPEARRRALEIPQWKFDRPSCCTMRLVDTPVVDWRALMRLRDVLRGSGANPSAPAVEHRHCSSGTEGDADAPDAGLPSNRSVGVVSSTAAGADLGADSSRCPAEDHHSAGQDAARASHTDMRRDKGGAT